MNARHVIKYRTATPGGRALAVVEWIEQTVGGHGYSYADVHALLASPTSELIWRELCLPLPTFNDADRRLVLDTLARRAAVWSLDITDHPSQDPARRPVSPPCLEDPFELGDYR